MDSKIEKRIKNHNIRKIIYGLPRFGTSFVLGVESFAIFTVYYIAYGLDPFLIGIALACGYVGIAIGQFLLGWISDAKYTRIGRRKPYFIIFAPLLAISFIFLFLPGLIFTDLNDKFKLFIWLLVWDVTFRFSYAVTTPYQAWMAESFDVKIRPEVSQYQNIFNYMGTGMMGVFTFFILTDMFDKLQDNPGSVPINFFLYIIGFGMATWIIFYLMIFLMPTEPHYKIDSNLIENLKMITKNKNYLSVVLMHGISGLAWAMISSIMLIYTEIVLGLDGLDYVIVGAFLVLGIFLFLYIWRRCIEKNGKKKNILQIFSFGIVFLPITLLGGTNLLPPLFLGILFILGIGIILGGWNLFPYIMYADLAEDNQNQTGQLKAGIYTGFPFLILNLFQAIGILILGIILSLPDLFSMGFSFGLLIWGPICSIILLCCYVYTKKYVRIDFEWEKRD